MKTCIKCKIEKSNKAFHSRTYKSGKKGLQAYCKVCAAKARVDYYRNNQKKEKAYDRKRKKLNKDFLWEIKKSPCVDCEKTYHPVCMDFDHLGNKSFELSDGIVNGFSQKRLLEEIKKCELVCSNCHRLRTWKRKQYR